ncbi:MAG: radical SAM protein [Candidatus Thorarchaeota archaeon]
MSPVSFGYPSFLEPPVFRPPSEANSLILQATLGCSHNRCTFCGSYRTKQFRVKPFSQFRTEVQQLAQSSKIRPRRIFLADGDAFVLSTSQILQTLQLLDKEFPDVDRISIYASSINIQRKSDKELSDIRDAGLAMVYLGLESGDDEVLKMVNKGISNKDQITACLRLKEAGFTLSPIIILGLGGKDKSQQHALRTAETINHIDPPYLAALTLMLVPGTELYIQAQQNQFNPLSPLEILQELRILVEKLTNLTQCIFRTNHASNYLPLRGILSRDRMNFLETIDSVLADPDAASRLRPEYIRGL